MEYISLNTAQNVRIEYDLASFTQRAIAGVLDIFITYIIPVIFFAIQTQYDTSNAVIVTMLVSICSFYPFISESFFNGFTIGKYFLNIRVVKIDATPLRFQDCLLRWFFNFLDIFLSIGSIAAFFYFTTNTRQRLGDLVAKTIVVTNSPLREVKLANILKIADSNNHIVKYEQVTQLLEKDLVFIKSILDNKKKYSIAVYDKILTEICNKVIEQLSLENYDISNKEAFLRNLIIDYVVLTR